MADRVRVVADEKALCETLSSNLEREDYVVQAVGDGRIALETA